MDRTEGGYESRIGSDPSALPYGVQDPDEVFYNDREQAVQDSDGFYPFRDCRSSTPSDQLRADTLQFEQSEVMNIVQSRPFDFDKLSALDA